MKKTSLILDSARRTLRIETAALEALHDSLDASFVDCVEAIYQSGGRTVVTGIGKTALVAKKMVATLNSTGTPSLFLHAADAIHGDLGMVQADDTVICLSKSGETQEITVLAGLVRQRGNRIIAVVCKKGSSLSRYADHEIYLPLTREADPNDLAPTASTTSQMAFGDALAISLLALRGFSPEDFALFHPGGSLGKQLYLRVGDLYPNNQKPAVPPSATLAETVIEMTAKCLGATAVVHPGDEKLLGIVTDGDLRRLLSRTGAITEVRAEEIMTKAPKVIGPQDLALTALERLRGFQISQLPVVENDKYLGFIHLHDLVREGLV